MGKNHTHHRNGCGSYCLLVKFIKFIMKAKRKKKVIKASIVLFFERLTEGAVEYDKGFRHKIASMK